MTATISNSVMLRQKLDLVIPQLATASGRIWSHPNLVGSYQEWLLTLHGMIRATVPLMIAALQQCQMLPQDPIAARLARYFARHIRDEFGHDEWVRKDHLQSGGTAEAFAAFVPGPEIASLVGAQYYWIQHVHPVALVGHIAVLEGYPPDPGLAPELARRSGLVADAFTTIARHSTLDLRHRDELLSLLDELPLTDEHHSIVGISALHTVQGVMDVVDAVMRRVPVRQEMAS